jgi:alkyl sulfatase BDS1-like metallo-beta-lactamase superfamily hydrolase
MAMALTIDQLIDSLAIRVDGPRAADTALTMDWQLTDERRTWHLTLSNGALTYRSAPGVPGGSADFTMSLTKPQLLGLLAGKGLEGIEHQGDPARLGALTRLLESPDPNFPIVTP